MTMVVQLHYYKLTTIEHNTHFILILFVVTLITLASCVPTHVPPCLGTCFKPKIGKNTTSYDDRIKLIKREILDKLGLDGPPNIKPSSKNIPQAVLDDFWNDTNMVHEEKTESFIILADTVPLSKCPNGNCIKFVFLKSIDPKQVNKLNVHLRVSKIDRYNKSKIKFIEKTTKQDLFQIHVKANEPGWFGFEIKDVKRWFDFIRGKNTRELALEIKFYNCVVDLKVKPPFLEIFEQKNSRTRVKRHTRKSTKCSKKSTSCCLDNFHITFTEIGFDWIKAPLSYNAAQCRGKCDSTVASITNHAGAMRHLSTRRNMGDGMKLCCSIQKYKPLIILYQDKENNFVKQELPNMITSLCGCG